MPTSPIYQSDSLKNNLETIYGIENEEPTSIRYTETVVKEKHLLKSKPLVGGLESWQIIILATTVLLLGFVKAFSNNRYRQGIKALFNYTVAQEIAREEKVFFHRSNIFLTLIHLFATALFIYQIKTFIVFPIENTFSYFLLILVVLIIIYSIKYLFSKMLLFLFNDISIAPEYIFNVSLYNNLFGVILIPILCIVYFTTLSSSIILFYFIIPITLFIFFLRLIRMFVIGKTKGVSYFYIFVYICSLEILPLVVLYRIFIHK